jgi:oxalate decarboxylase/phosphoglucose isomerase-like protein (cupin superfamily)
MEIINLPKIEDPRGNLTFIQNRDQIPFKIQRVYWIYDVPGGEERGGHAYKKSKELIIALSGSFDIIIKEPESQKVIHCSRSYEGIYVPSRTWRKLTNFSTNSLALVLSSTKYTKDDYIRSFKEFKRIKKTNYVKY